MNLYCLNQKVDICEDDKNVDRFKSDDGIVGMLFTSLPRLLKRSKHVDMSAGKWFLFSINKQFVVNLNKYLKDNLPNAINYKRMFLTSIK